MINDILAVTLMAAALQLDNQEFDSIKFFKACGL